MEDQTFQPILAKLNDFLSKEPMEVTHFDNLLNEELVEIIHSTNLFIEKLVQSNITSLTIHNLIKRRMCNDLYEPKLVQMGDKDLLTK